MIDQKTAWQAASQLKSLRFCTDEVVLVSAAILLDCESKEHAKTVVEDMILSHDDWPGPATLGRFVSRHRGQSDAQPECSKCGDMGAIFLDGKREELSVERVRARLKAGTLRLCVCGMAGFWNEWGVL